MKKIILASASPRRRELLATAGIDFEIRTAEVDESIPEGTEPLHAAEMTAEKKALAASRADASEIVIGADTIVVAKDKILGKPRDKADAAAMLAMLSGAEHEVITGVCLICGDKKSVFAKVSRVKFYDLTAEEIEKYVETGEPMDKAGAYGIQGRGCTLVEKIEGDYFNIVGLPVARVCREIEKMSR